MQQSENSMIWEDSGTWDRFRTGTWEGSRTFKGSGGGPNRWLEWEERARSRRDFKICSLNDVPVVTTAGEIDIQNGRQLTHTLLAAGSDATIVVADMTATIFIDAAGLGALIGAYQRLQDNGTELRIATINPRIRWMIAFFGEDRRLRVFDTLPEAVTAMPANVSTENWSPYRRAA